VLVLVVPEGRFERRVEERQVDLGEVDQLVMRRFSTKWGA
jgi:hypothetical protein